MLLAYAKLSLYDDLLQSRGARRPLSRPRAGPLFSEGDRRALSRCARTHHRLRREIIATQLANSMINRGGPSLIVRIADQTGAAPAAIATAFAAVRDSYGMTALNAAIDELDNRDPRKLQLELYAAVQDLLLDRIVWFLRNVDLGKGLADVVAHYRDGIAAVTAASTAPCRKTARARARRGAGARRAGVPDALAGRLADLGPLAAAPDIVLIADRTGKPVGDVAATYFAAGASSSSTALPARCRPSRSPIISTGWRSTAPAI